MQYRFGYPLHQITVMTAALLLLLGQTSIPAAPRWSEGRWRLDLSAGGSTDFGETPEGVQGLVSGSVEYEIPATRHLSLGLRLLPLFLVNQEVEKGHWLHRTDSHDETVWGGGLGLALRIYQVPGEQRGFYGVLQSHTVLHDGRIEGNSSNLNFLIGAGLGYQFRNGVHTELRFDHISNGGLEDHNAGANFISAGIGYSF